MKDRFIRGFIAGILAGIVASIWNLSAYHILNISKLRFLDFAAILTYGRVTDSILEVIFSELTVNAFYGALGTTFAYGILLIISVNLLFKG